MRKTELRIGNLVNGVLTQKPYIIDAWALREMENGNYQNSQDTETKVFEPIPLTEEWLLKFGFEYYDTVKPKGYWLNGVCIEKIDSMLIEFKNGIGLKHVHQLQNLYFALTNEELTFKSE